MIKKIFFMILGNALILAACTTSGSSANANENATLAPVPTEYAGLTNPLGVEAATQGAEIFKTNCEMCHEIWQSCKQKQVMIFCSGAFVRASQAPPWWRGREF